MNELEALFENAVSPTLNEENEEESEEAGAEQPAPALKKKLTYEDFPAEDLYTYGGIDCLVTSGVLSKLVPLAAEVTVGKGRDSSGRAVQEAFPSVLDGYLNIEAPALEFILDLEQNGLKYSSARNRYHHRRMEKQIAELDELIFSQIGKEIDLNSGPAIAEFLYKERGFEPPSYTKANEPSTDGEALLTLAGLDPLTGKPKKGKPYVTEDPALQYLAHMAKRKDIASVHRTFIKNYIRDFLKRDGRIHPSYSLHGTSSFRISGSDPNLTQLPRAKHGYNVRDCYITEEGTVFIAVDFSSAEVKILAFLSREPAMLQAIADGMDFHTFSASAMRGIPYDVMAAVLENDEHHLYKEYKGYRQLAKILTFSILYGSSTSGIAAQLYMTVDEAQRLVNLYFTTFPKVKDFIEKSHFYARMNQFICTPLAQRKQQFGTLPCFKGTAAYNASMRNAQNVSIQSPTSSIGLATFAEVNRQIKPFGAKSICTVYDSLEIECPIEHAAEVVNLTIEILDNYPSQAFPFVVLPIGCEAELGISWGECKVVHKGVTQEQVLSLLEKIKAESIETFDGWLV